MMAWVSVLWMVVVLWPGRVESVLTYLLSGRGSSMASVRKHREFLAVTCCMRISVLSTRSLGYY